MSSYRIQISVSEEIKDMLIADAALTIAFAMIMPSIMQYLGLPAIGNGTWLVSTLYYMPIALVAASISFILHEYMHKRTAQHFGAVAAFRRSDMGIIITLVSGFVGFLMALPGATVIYTNSFTRRENGYVSLAGPLTNFAIFGIVAIISLFIHSGNAYVQNAVFAIMFISMWIAFVNMLPIYPLDGSKILHWNKLVYGTVLIATIAVLFLLVPALSLIISIGIVLVMATIMSFFARNIVFRGL